MSGLLNKQVGGELGISEITVKAHGSGHAKDESGFSRGLGDNIRQARCAFIVRAPADASCRANILVAGRG